MYVSFVGILSLHTLKVNQAQVVFSKRKSRGTHQNVPLPVKIMDIKIF